jgi:hypothetical protein
MSLDASLSKHIKLFITEPSVWSTDSFGHLTGQPGVPADQPEDLQVINSVVSVPCTIYHY